MLRKLWVMDSLKKGGTRVKVPLFNGDLGISQDFGYMTKNFMANPTQAIKYPLSFNH